MGEREQDGGKRMRDRVKFGVLNCINIVPYMAAQRD